jgi:hypothetical protein
MIVKQKIFWNLENATDSHQHATDRALREIVSIAQSVDAFEIVDYYQNRGTDKMKSISTPVNRLIIENLKLSGWETPWRYIAVNSQQATFEAAKEFVIGADRVRIGLDIGSRHRMSALGYFLRGEFADSSFGENRLSCHAVVILSFTERTIQWGNWNPANSSFESLQREAEIAIPLMTKPLVLIGLDPPANLTVESRANGTLRLTEG